MMERGRVALILAVVALLMLCVGPVAAQQAEDTVQAATLLAAGKADLDRAPSLDNYKAAADKFRQAIQMAPSFSTGHYYLGMGLYLTGRQILRTNDLELEKANVPLGEALTELAKASELAPNASGPVLYTGLVHLLRSEYMQLDPKGQQQELAAAEQALARAISAAALNDRCPAYEAMGRVLVSQGDIVRGLQNFDWALEIDPNHAWARYNRALALFDMGRYTDVDEECSRLNKTLTEFRREKYFLDQLDANGRTNADQAQQTRDAFAEKYGGVSDFSDANMWPSVYKLQGRALNELDQFTAARGCYTQAMSPQHDGNSESLELRTMQAEELLAQAEWTLRVEGRVTDPKALLKGADDKITEVLKDCDNSYPYALEVRGRAYLLESEVYKAEGDKKGHQLEDARDALAKAVEAYVTARKINSEYPEARSGRNYARCLAIYGYSLTQLGELPKAMEQFRTGLAEGDANSWPCLLYQAYALAKADGAKSHGETASLVRRVTAQEVGLAWKEFEALYIGSRALYEAGKACLSAGLAASQPEGDLVRAGGDLLHEAATLAKRASEMAPRDARPRIVEAGCYYELGQMGGAEAVYGEALALIPPSRAVKLADEKAQVLFRLAYCNYIGGVHEIAIKYANEAVAQDTAMWQAREIAADSYTALRRFDAADTAYRGAFDLAPAGSADQARILAAHGHCLMLMGRAQDSELMILRSLAMFATAPPADLSDVVKAERTARAQVQAAEDLKVVQSQLQSSAAPGA
jgi:tetratricopeptide (TPR) repeat protein